jgi:hypothetical protein
VANDSELATKVIAWSSPCGPPPRPVVEGLHAGVCGKFTRPRDAPSEVAQKPTSQAVRTAEHEALLVHLLRAGYPGYRAISRGL